MTEKQCERHPHSVMGGVECYSCVAEDRLREIFAAKGPGVATEAFGEDDFLLNMSSRANSGEDLTPEQRDKIEAIWKRVTGRTPS